jgi:streptomycin 6-kinase
MRNAERSTICTPATFFRRMAELLELDVDRVRLWLFARCVQESIRDLAMRQLARRLTR